MSVTDRRFYVRREECWGGTYVWYVLDRTRKRKAQRFTTYTLAKKFRERMEADHRRFFNATGRVA